MSKPEMYVSIDIETDGPAAGINSMLSLGAALFTRDGNQVGEWYRKLEPLAGGVRDGSTMAWWGTQPEAWKEVGIDQESPFYAIPEFALWCEEFGESSKIVAAAWPAAFDFSFVNYYMWRFAGRNPLGHACLDIRSYANGLFMVPGYYGKIPKGDLYAQFGVVTDDLRPHFAIDDAIRQGRLLMAILDNISKVER